MHQPVLSHLAWAMEILIFNQNAMGCWDQTPTGICDDYTPKGESESLNKPLQWKNTQEEMSKGDVPKKLTLSQHKMDQQVASD